MGRAMALPSTPTESVPAVPAFAWPLRQSINEVVQQASQAAMHSGVSIRSLTGSHQLASHGTLGRVNLDVSASGGYAALKAWQADVSQHFAALSVQGLRVQAAAGTAAGLESHWTWVLHVRD